MLILMPQNMTKFKIHLAIKQYAPSSCTTRTTQYKIGIIQQIIGIKSHPAGCKIDHIQCNSFAKHAINIKFSFFIEGTSI